MSYRNKYVPKKIMHKIQIYHHNIKGNVLPKNATTILDIGSGKLNDLNHWRKAKISVVYCIEIDKNSIDLGKKIYKKYLSIYKWMPKIIYINDDALNPNLIKKDSLLYPAREQINHVICNFAFHYFMKNKQTFKRIMDLINFCLKPGGSFRFMTLNGDIINNLLQNKKKHIISIYNQYNIYKIIKMWDTEKDIGQKINVYVLSIGKWHEENLIKPSIIIPLIKKNYPCFFNTKLKSFSEFQNIIIRDIVGNVIPNFNMKPEEKEMSFLHVYIEFKKMLIC